MGSGGRSGCAGPARRCGTPLRAAAGIAPEAAACAFAGRRGAARLALNTLAAAIDLQPWPCPTKRRMQRRSEEHTSELQSRPHLVCRLLLEKKKKNDAETATLMI